MEFNSVTLTLVLLVIFSPVFIGLAYMTVSSFKQADKEGKIINIGASIFFITIVSLCVFL